MKVYAFVPAKGTSERIENKNMRFLAGERLYIRALKTLLNCKEIDKVFLDTESEEMYRFVDYLPVQFMKRDASFASNATDGHALFRNEVRNYPDADIYVQLLCTSPFIKPETIDNAIRIIKEDTQFDSVIMMQKSKCYFWKDNHPCYDINHIPNSKDLPETLTESMGLYIHKKDSALKLNRRYGENPYFVYGDLEELIDVNTPEDFEYAEIYATGKKNKEIATFQLLRHHLSSSALSDILDDIELEKGEKCGAVLNGFQSNMAGTRLLGRANTLKLRALKKGEDYRGIYSALMSYDGITDGDIIIVENEVPDFAYFGDLNARLAIRSGAIGAIINGATRDQDATKQLSFPVFSRGCNATDVRRRATLEYINKPIKVCDEVIHPGDLVFIDDCAMAVIYRKYESEIIERVLGTFYNEKNIIRDIVEQKDVTAICNVRGSF